MRTVVAVALVLSGLLAGSPARAEDIPNCYGVAYDQDLSDITLGVIGVPKVHFLANQSDRPECPSDANACIARAFLRKKDQVIVSSDPEAARGGYVCASYINNKGEETDGWLPAEAVGQVAAAPRLNWLGSWKRDSSAQIEITRRAKGQIEISGDATWGQGTATHEGSLEGVVDAASATVSFAISGGDSQIAYDKAGEYDCAVIMKQLGPYLFVADNNNCGGANVSFTGIYVRR